jgi:uncharacterized protein YjbK
LTFDLNRGASCSTGLLSWGEGEGSVPIRREIEIKLRLEGRAQYDKLCRKMGAPTDSWEQVNHYFRSEDGTIPGEEGVIRIRLERGKAVFTVKLGALKGGLASSREYEEAWRGPPEEMPPPSTAMWDAGHSGLHALEQKFGKRFPLVWVGKMINRRRLYRTAEGLCMEVDASRYPDGEEDYEVEVETDDPERDRGLLEGLLGDMGIRFSPQQATKYQRFLRHAAKT